MEAIIGKYNDRTSLILIKGNQIRIIYPGNPSEEFGVISVGVTSLEDMKQIQENKRIIIVSEQDQNII